MQHRILRSGLASSIRQTFLWVLLPSIVLLLSAPTVGDAQVTTSVTSSGLNTQVNQVGNSFNITGGTRPGNGPNLFHSFGDFSVGVGDIGNFQNTGSFPVTSNILGRVTGGNISNIYGTIQTTNFGNANLFLMNPSGIVLGPNASLNVGGSVSFTTAQYIRLFDGVAGNANFNANPANDGLANSILAIDPSAFEFLSATPAAYGFLTSPDPNATLTVQGSALSVPSGQSISLVGGKVVIEGGAQLSAPSGKIQLASAASPGEFDATTLGSFPNADFASFTSFGSVSLAPGSIINVSGTQTVFIRGGQLVLSVNDATLSTSESPAPSDTVSLSPGSSIVTSNSGADPGADVQITTGNLQMDGAMIQSINSGDLDGGNILINSTTVGLANGALILSSTGLDFQTFAFVGSGKGGDVTIQGLQGAGSAADSVTFSNGGSINTSTFGSGQGGATLITSGTMQLDSGATITSNTFGDGNGGNITANVATLSLTNGSGIDTFNSTVGLGRGGDLIIQGLSGAEGSAADSVTLDSSSHVTTQTGSGPGRGGDVSITTNTLQVNNGSLIDSVTSFGTGSGGDISLNVENLTVSGGSLVRTTDFSLGILDQDGALDPSSVGAGGNLTVQGINGAAADSVVLSGNSQLGTQAQDGAGGSLSIKTSSLSLDGGSSIFTTTSGFGRGGDINVMFQQASLEGGTTIATGTFAFDQAAGAGGKIMLQGLDGNVSKADSLTLNGFASGLVSDSFGLGSPGAIEVHANTVSLRDQAVIAGGNPLTTGTGGRVTIDADSVGIAGGSRISSQAFAFDAGQVTITANQLTQDNGSIVTTSASPIGGRGGDVVVHVGNVSLANGSTINSSASETGLAGDITILANGSVTMTNGSTISASSTGSGNAGNIMISSGNQVTMTNSSVTTEASQASGGQVTITAPEMVQLNNSKITTSVAGSDADTAGGNISIDPQFVVLNSSQILATAIAGTGGNISIVSNVFLSSADSVVDATSQLGVSGTIDIRSPVSNISGVIGRMPESVLVAQALLRAACAARLAESQVSSFVERGRDSIPIGPDGMLATPYLPPSSEPSSQMGVVPVDFGREPWVGSFRPSGIQVRRLMGPHPTPRVQLLSGDIACGS